MPKAREPLRPKGRGLQHHPRAVAPERRRAKEPARHRGKEPEGRRAAVEPERPERPEEAEGAEGQRIRPQQGPKS